jgi:GDPmannose 4,6-dehydratase
MDNRVVVFGINGQDGGYLRSLSRKRAREVVGVGRKDGDLSNFTYVCNLLLQLRPTHVFHLAANSTTRHDALFENHATISTGTINIFEAVRLHCPGCKVFIAGSGLQFVNLGHPISERDDFAATSAYSMSRIQSVYAARYYRSLGVKAYVGYLFHHDSPLRPEKHVSAAVAAAARRIAAGDKAPLLIGDMSVRKEWGHARDIVDGMWALVSQDEVFEATIGTGVDHSIQEWIEACFSVVGLNWQDWTQQRDGFKAEYSRLVSDPSTMRGLGWAPKESLFSLAREMVEVPAPTSQLP